ncbi:MAG: DUF2783 domain-containing protein [Pseudomonadota bacterium]
MSQLLIDPNIDDPDGFYAELISLHDGLSDDESMELNARLVLILANQIGDRQILTHAMQAALAAKPTGEVR